MGRGHASLLTNSDTWHSKRQSRGRGRARAAVQLRQLICGRWPGPWEGGGGGAGNGGGFALVGFDAVYTAVDVMQTAKGAYLEIISSSKHYVRMGGEGWPHPEGGAVALARAHDQAAEVVVPDDAAAPREARREAEADTICP